MKVLLVEDNRVNAEAAKAMLTQDEIKLPISEFHWAKSLSETKQIIADQPLDIIVLDLGLPDSDGANTLKEVRNIYKGPIIVLTSDESEDIKLKAKEIGVTDFIVKGRYDDYALIHSIVKISIYNAALKIQENLNSLSNIKWKS